MYTDSLYQGSCGCVAPPDSLDHEQLLACARGDIFGPGNARLPMPPMLMFDRITETLKRALASPQASTMKACSAATAST